MWAVDPGDMRTQMHQDAFPGEDISDRPLPRIGGPGPARPDRRRTAERTLPGRFAADRRTFDGRRVVTAVTGDRIAGERIAGERRLRGLASFVLPPHLEATSPPEARGLSRDAVRMMVAYRQTGALVHSHFCALPQFLHEGDLVVVNTSGTLAAEIDGSDPAGRPTEVHLSTQLPAGLWTVELRRSGQAWLGAAPGTVITLAGGGQVVVLSPFARHPDGVRLWIATLSTPAPLDQYLPEYGRPISYRYVDAALAGLDLPECVCDRSRIGRDAERGPPVHPRADHPLWWRPGSAWRRCSCTRGWLRWRPESRPTPEQYRVLARAPRTGSTTPGVTAAGSSRWVPRSCGPSRRSSTSGAWSTRASGWTETIVTSDRPVRAVDGLLTGWHEPEASHLAMLEAVAGRELLERSYGAALAEGYLWHEFGDVHLVLP